MTVLFLLAFLLPAPSPADETGWTDLAPACESELRPDWIPFGSKGLTWEVSSAENLRLLGTMAEKTCPAYFQRPNDGVAIRAFQGGKAAVLDTSPRVESQGRELIQFLERTQREYQATFAPLQIDFSASACGTQLWNIQQRMVKRLNDIRAKVGSLTTSCFTLTAEEAKRNLAAKKPAENRGQGAPAKVPAGKQKQGASDITGVKQDLEKRKAP